MGAFEVDGWSWSVRGGNIVAHCPNRTHSLALPLRVVLSGDVGALPVTCLRDAQDSPVRHFSLSKRTHEFRISTSPPLTPFPSPLFPLPAPTPHTPRRAQVVEGPMRSALSTLKVRHNASFGSFPSGPLRKAVEHILKHV